MYLELEQKSNTSLIGRIIVATHSVFSQKSVQFEY